MKNFAYLFVICLCFFGLSTTAQAGKSIHSLSFTEEIEKVIAEYFNNFNRSKGAVIDKNPQSTEYASLLKVASARKASITEYSSVEKPVYSWQCIVLATEKFAAASGQYSWVCRQLKEMSIYEQYELEGEYEAPDESRKFAGTEFRVKEASESLKKIVIEASLQFEFPEWKVKLLVYEKEREADDDSNNEEEAVGESEEEE